MAGRTATPTAPGPGRRRVLGQAHRPHEGLRPVPHDRVRGGRRGLHRGARRRRVRRSPTCARTRSRPLPARPRRARGLRRRSCSATSAPTRSCSPTRPSCARKCTHQPARRAGRLRRGGGGLVMVGGYLSFTGIDGRARYGESPLAAVLPVDDARPRRPGRGAQGVTPAVADAGHPALGGTPASGRSCSATTGCARKERRDRGRHRRRGPAAGGRRARRRAHRSPSPPIARRTGRRRSS